MPAYARSHDSALLIRFTRDGEPDEVAIAATPERALGVALTMLAHHEALYIGDKLTIEADADLPQVSVSAQHGS
jgi:hypothetical protein